MRWLSGLLLLSCATTRYEPSRVVPGSMTLRYDDGVRVFTSDGTLVAKAPAFEGLGQALACHDEPRVEASAAERYGVSSRMTGVAAIIFTVASAVGFGALGDPQHEAAWLGGGLGSAALGLGLAFANIALRHEATGHAVDAVNLHNDVVYSGGGGCVAGSP